VCNRHWSFASAKKQAIGRSFASYVSMQGAGLVCNLIVYSAALLVVTLLSEALRVRDFLKRTALPNGTGRAN
jgi:hypothetical protein